MKHIGPPLETLTRRLAETPQDFVDDASGGVGSTIGRTFVAALVQDTLSRFGGTLPDGKLDRFRCRDQKPVQNRLALVRIVVWLLYDEWFITARLKSSVILQLLDEGIVGLAETGKAENYVVDPERREELARTVLARLDFRPAGETEAQAGDRLTALSVAERNRLIAASRAAEKRAREIREALGRKAAAESADKWGRE